MKRHHLMQAARPGEGSMRRAKGPATSLWLTLLGLFDQLDEAFHRLNLLAFGIVELWIVALVDCGA